MYQSINLPLCGEAASIPGGWDSLRQDIAALGLDGVEGIWAGEDIPAAFPRELLVGYHLTFFPEWLDFYRQDKKALTEKFGGMEQAEAFYGGPGPEAILRAYREDLRRAEELGAKYVVFHVSDVSNGESYTYRWLHTSREVIDASVEVINQFMGEKDRGFDFLVENQWWPGFTFTEPELTARLLEGIRYPRKGILLDTGHLMNACTEIKNQGEGLDFIHEMLDRHGELSRLIRGMHLHQSVSGAYVRKHTGFLPQDFPRDYLEQFGYAYSHVLQIDRHRPWTNPAVAQLVARIAPAYLTHELAAPDYRTQISRTKRQLAALFKGGLPDVAKDG